MHSDGENNTVALGDKRYQRAVRQTTALCIFCNQAKSCRASD